MKKVNMREITEAISMVTQFGINMIVPMGAMVALGIWIGDKYNMKWIVIPLFFVGVVAGYNSIYRMIKKFLKTKDTRAKKENNVKKN